MQTVQTPSDPSPMKKYPADMIQDICISGESLVTKSDEKFMTIDSPSETLGHPMIGMDIKGLVSKIRSYNRQCSRRNPLFAIVTGVGRGKTRTLVELNN